MSESSSGRSDRLDHLRGLAAFMVFAWHFTHVRGVFPAIDTSWLALLEEGHTGVALFMVLSGYLFARITGDKAIDFGRFVVTRVRRLAPLLLVGLAAAYAVKPQLWRELPLGLILPMWDNGCWSIAIELQFYALLPVLLYAFRRWPAAPIAIIAAAAGVRALVYGAGGDLQTVAYYTLVGRIDQFVLGMAAWRLLGERKVASPLFVGGFGAFLVALHGFDLAGGMAGTADSPIWIWWPTVEGLGFALLIAWYAGQSWSLPSAFAFVGRVSYSMYILHFLFVVPLALFAMDALKVTDVHQMMGLAALAFAAMLPLSWLSWQLFERPFTGGRRTYLTDAEPDPMAQPARAQA